MPSTTDRPCVIDGTRHVRLRRLHRTIGPYRMVVWTLTDPFSRKHLIPVQMLESQARLLAEREGWRINA